MSSALVKGRGYSFGRMKKFRGIKCFDTMDSIRITSSVLKGVLSLLFDLLGLVREGSEYKNKAKLTGMSLDSAEHILEPARGGYRRIVRMGLDNDDAPFFTFTDQYNPSSDNANERSDKKDVWYDRVNSGFNFQIETYQGIQEFLYRLQFFCTHLDPSDELNAYEKAFFFRLEELFDAKKEAMDILLPEDEYTEIVKFTEVYADASNYSKPTFNKLFEKLAANQHCDVDDVFNVFSRSAHLWALYQQIAYFKRVLDPLLDRLIKNSGF